MKQFAKAALAVFVGVMVYDACNDALHAVIRRSKRKKKNKSNTSLITVLIKVGLSDSR